MVKYDIIVIGGGPAGLLAAKTAAENGLTVLLVEQKKEISKIGRCCASMVILDPGFHGEFVHFEGSKIIFPRFGFSVNYSGECVNLTSSIRISPSGYCLTLGDGKSVFAKVVEKEVLLEDLLNEAVDNGVEIMNETIGVKAQNTSNGTEVHLKTPEGMVRMESLITIAADGANSRIASSLGLNVGRKLFFTGKVVSYILEDVECPYANAFIRLMGSEFKGGVYMLPKPPRNKGEPQLFEVIAPSREMLERIIYHSKYSMWFKNSRLVRRRAASVPLYSPILEPVVGKIMVISDAAAWQEAEIQGALMCGYYAAQAATEEIETRNNSLKKYTHFWNSSFEFCWPGVVERSMQYFQLHGKMFNDYELDYIYKLVQDDYIQGTVNHFKAGTYELQAFLRHIDRIKTERPELATKIEKLKQTVKYV